MSMAVSSGTWTLEMLVRFWIAVVLTTLSGIQYLVKDAFPSSQAEVDTDAVFASFDRPLKFVNASDFPVLAAFALRGYKSMPQPKAFATVDGADHGFTLEPHALRLFAETTEWLERHGRPNSDRATSSHA